MPVQVQLPGYNRNVIAENIANTANAAMGAYQGFKKGQVEDQDLKAKTFAYQRSQDLLKQANDENSPMSDAARNSAMGRLGVIAKAKVAQNPDTQQGLARLSDIIKNGAPQQDPQTGGITRKPLSATQVDQIFTENTFLKDMNDQVLAQTKADAQAPMVAAKTKMADAMVGRLEETKNQNAVSAGEAFEKDPIIRASKGSINSLTRSVSILDNPNKPVTNKDLTLAYNDYINAVANGGAATEGKIAREMPDTFEQQWNDLKLKAGKTDDLRQTPDGKALIEMLRENVHTVKRDLRVAIDEQAKNLGASFAQSSNPKVKRTVEQKVQSYAQEPETKGPAVDSDLTKMNPQQLQEYIKTHGR